ncbi:peripherin-2-like [Paramacrobiotus metropolitanus]|uniref:peripherin-2-like n=1 Tax=Paramacrobiotus metropolitanus TaxID=2943436 RepID=UPI00244581EB|nr:peripherin-2-like [Paramacrobiotus metropolitanus]
MRLPEEKQFQVVLRHTGRGHLATILVSLCTLGIMTSLSLMAVGIAIHESVAPYRAVLDDYDGAYLSFILGGLGLTGLTVHSLLVFCLLDFTNPERSDHFGRVSITIVISAGLTMIAGIICFAHIREVQSAFRSGLSFAMKNYKNNTMQKSAMDEVQMRYECCGIRNYRDWFNISWVNQSYVDKNRISKNMKNGEFKPDDVPFSCCDPSVFRPCIHEAVHTNSHHFNYNHAKNVTIFTSGCLEKIKNFFGPGLLFIMGGLVCCIALMDFGIAAGTRILYTSLLSAVKRGDEYGPGIGIVWPGRILVYRSSTDLRRA